MPVAHIRQFDKMPCDIPQVQANTIHFSGGANKPSLVISGVGIIFYGKVRTKVKVLHESAFAITRVCRLP